MKFAITIVLISMAALGGCNSCFDAFNLVEVGEPLPDKLPAGLYRTAVGLGCVELPGWPSIPVGQRYRSLRVLTDDNGVVVGKALFNTTPPSLIAIEYGTTATVIRTTTLEVQVPPEWWNEPAPDWGRDIPTACAWPAVRKYLYTHQEKEQRAFIRKWRDWYERSLDASRAPLPRMAPVAYAVPFAPFGEDSESPTTGPAGPQKHSERTAFDFLCLAAQLLEAVPAGPDGTLDDVSDGEAHVADAPIWLASLGQDDLGPRQVIVDGFKWRRETEDLKVTCENLGDRRIRLEVVRRERMYLRPAEDLLPNALGKICTAMLGPWGKGGAGSSGGFSGFGGGGGFGGIGPGSIKIDPGSINICPGSINICPGSINISPGSINVSP